jgi:CubicO group peptidase (beta-lactamase class C family)
MKTSFLALSALVAALGIPGHAAAQVAGPPPVAGVDDSMNARVRNELATYSAKYVHNTDGPHLVQAYCVVLVSNAINAALNSHPAIYSPYGSAIYCDGEVRAGNGVVPRSDTFFAIGSITKTFVAALLADDVLHNRRCYSDTAIDYLDGSGVSGWSTPSRWTDWGDKSHITLLELATHYSGLAHDEGNMPDQGVACQPYNSTPCDPYTTTELLEALRDDDLALTPNTAFHYSNFGYAVLSHAVTGSPTWHDRAYQLLLAPLGMYDTGIALAASHHARLAAVNDLDANTPLHNYYGAAGSGAYYSTAADMKRWLEWHMARTKILPRSGYPSTLRCGLADFSDPFGFTSAAPDPDPVVNEVLRPRKEGHAYPEQVGLSWYTTPSTDSDAFAIIDKSGGATVGSSRYTSKIEIALHIDGTRPSGVFVVGVGAHSTGALADTLLRILETP